MNIFKKNIYLILTFILFTSGFSQEKEWDTETTDDGKITVRSAISERIDENNEEVQLVEYSATTIEKVKLEHCVAVIKDISKHIHFSDETEVSKKLKTVSDNEWIVYYFYNAPWPVPNSDSVMRMKFMRDSLDGSVKFTFTAEAELYDEQDVDRISYHYGTYELKDLGNGDTELTATAKFSPSFQVPGWLIRGFFPDGPADELRAILNLAKELEP